MKSRSLKFKLGLLVSLSIFIVTVILTVYSTYSVRGRAIEAARENLGGQVAKIAGQVQERIEDGMAASRTLAQTYTALKVDSDSIGISREQSDAILIEMLEQNQNYFATYAAFAPNAFDGQDHRYQNTVNHDSTGHYLPYWSKDANGKLLWEPLVFYRGKAEYYHGPKEKLREVITDPAVFRIHGKRMPVISLSVPVHQGRNFYGVAGVDMTLDWLHDLIDNTGLYDGNSRISIIANSGKFAAVSKNDTVTCKPATLLLNDIENMQLALHRQEAGQEIVHDTLRVFAPIPIGRSQQPWQVAIEVPLEFVMARANQLMWTNILIGGALCIGALFLTLYFLRKTLKPIERMVQVCNEMAEGEVQTTLEINRKDEIGDMAKAMNLLLDNLKKTGLFAAEIGQGKLDAQFEAVSERDTLGMALIEMRDNLKKVKQEDEKRNWATRGQAHFGELLRNQHENIGELAETILVEMVNYLDANQGALYILEENDKDQQVLKLHASYAWGRKKFQNHELMVGEGLAGQAVLEKDVIYLTDVPSEYIKIRSGLGDATPSAVLIVPLMINEDLMGVIELASFKEFEKYQIEFVSKIGESIASTLSTAKVNEQTRRLLEETKTSSEELRAVEEELRQNQEELEATQEEMNRTLLAVKNENEELKKENDALKKAVKNQ